MGYDVTDWRPVKGYEGIYEVNCEGRLWTLRRDREMFFKRRLDGYVTVMLCKHGKQSCHQLSRIVAEAFVPNPHGYDTVDHINGDKSDNRAENLQWLPRGENTRKSFENPERRRKCSEFIKGQLERGELKPIRVRNVETGEEFPSYHKAGKAVGRSDVAIMLAIRRGGTCAGYHWETVKEGDVKEENE